MNRIWIAIAIPSTLLIALLFTSSWGAEGRLALWWWLAIFAPLLFYRVLRELSLYFLRRNMLERTPGAVPAARVGTAPDGAGEDGCTTPERAAAAPALQPELVEYDAASEILLEDSARQRFHRAWWCGRQTLGIYLLALAIYFLLSCTLLLCGNSETGAWVWGAGAFCALFATIALVVYWVYRRVGLALGILTTAGATALGVVAAGSIGATALLPPLGFGVSLLLARRWIRRRMFIDGNYTLLILRVFDAERSSDFTFGATMEKWRHLGRYLTIVDPSYLRFRSSLRNRRNALRAVLGLGLAYLILFQTAVWGSSLFARLPILASWWEPLSVEEKRYGGVLIVLLVLMPLAALPVYFLLRGKFSPSLAAARTRIAAFKQRNMRVRGVFGGLAIYCFENVWRPVVLDLLKEADVVLLDLRGFSPEHDGCEYEIAQVIDRFLLAHVVFVVDRTTSLGDLYGYFRECWARMDARSPNRMQEPVRIQIYNVRKRDRRDTRQLLKLLAASVKSKPVPAAETATLGELQTAQVQGSDSIYTPDILPE